MQRGAHASTSRRSRASPAYARSRRATSSSASACDSSRNPRPVLTPKSPRRDVLAQDAGGGEARAEAALERLVDVRVDVEPRHVGDRERPEEREPEAERRAHDLVDLLGRGEAVLHDPGRLPEHRELDPVGDEPGAVADDDGGLAEPRQRSDDLLARPARPSTGRGSPPRTGRAAAARTSASRGSGPAVAAPPRARRSGSTTCSSR